MCIEMTQSPMAVYCMQDGATVTVNGVRMIFSVTPYASMYGYFITEDSDVDGYHKRDAEEIAKLDKDDPHYDFIVKHMGECYQSEYIKYLRPCENGAPMCTREEFFKMFTTGNFIIN